MNTKTRKRIDETKARIDTSPEGLTKLRDDWLPEGSGPLASMSYVAALAELLLEEKLRNSAE